MAITQIEKNYIVILGSIPPSSKLTKCYYIVTGVYCHLENSLNTIWYIRWKMRLFHEDLNAIWRFASDVTPGLFLTEITWWTWEYIIPV